MIRFLERLDGFRLKVLVLLIFIAPFATSFILEHFLSLIPCILCIAERWMHFISFLFAGLFIRYSGGKYSLLVVLMCIGINFGVTVYHIGVEYGIFESSCDDFSIENIYSVSVKCSIAKYFLGVKLTFWNILYCIFEFFTIFLYKSLTIKK
ncbi:disulfide bond formation protein B [Candidatus Deianiraea vastatrix]|uniref:DsbB family disulfide bond formation protein n=1 Tax=Candidatus Deianiraea vastatrix TaxID=2163644 RepID=A0A5B8XE95_9RICK|nr:disulfide bond formation protein B [Candidatus Deianiraea vastatrix]QED23632.1 DsbB family disulfide bond formation protein [Candidatus Deianiraea vastatrix]